MRSRPALILLSLASLADIELDRAKCRIGVGGIDACAVRGIAIVGTIDRAGTLGRVEAKLGGDGAFNAFGVVCGDAAGLLGLLAGFTVAASALAVALF